MSYELFGNDFLDPHFQPRSRAKPNRGENLMSLLIRAGELPSSVTPPSCFFCFSLIGASSDSEV